MSKPNFKMKLFRKVLISSSILLGTFFTPFTVQEKSNAAPGMIEFQWDPDPSFKRLRSLQTSSEKADRSTYYLFLRSKERKAGILQLTVKLPDYFNAKLKAKKIKLCQVKIGGFKDKTRCIKDIPAVIEVGKEQTSIDIFPDNPIPIDKKSYAVVIKLFNPTKNGMFHFHGYAQSTGAVPVSSYIGSWSLNVE